MLAPTRARELPRRALLLRLLYLNGLRSASRIDSGAQIRVVAHNLAGFVENDQ
jgi:hypothetical protein